MNRSFVSSGRAPLDMFKLVEVEELKTGKSADPLYSCILSRSSLIRTFSLLLLFLASLIQQIKFATHRFEISTGLWLHRHSNSWLLLAPVMVSASIWETLNAVWMFLSTLILNFCVHLSLTSAYGIVKNFYPNVLPRGSVAWLLLKKRILFISSFNLTAFWKPSGLSKCVFQVIMHSKLLENSL